MPVARRMGSSQSAQIIQEAEVMVGIIGVFEEKPDSPCTRHWYLLWNPNNLSNRKKNERSYEYAHCKLSRTDTKMVSIEAVLLKDNHSSQAIHEWDLHQTFLESWSLGFWHLYGFDPRCQSHELTYNLNWIARKNCIHAPFVSLA